MKWKDRLLSSSLPLEMEVARLLATRKFSISLDYPYKRFDNKEEKEFSIDILSQAWYPFELSEGHKIDINFLIECKYRNPNVSWLFVEDMNTEELANFTTKGVIKLIDEFTDSHVSNRHCDVEMRTCLKGVELNTANNEVHEIGILHGSRQLIYAMPELVKSHINHCLYDGPEDCQPYIICPILITTADLRILHSDFSISSLNNCSSLEEICEVVPYVRYYSELDPSFKSHCKNLFKNMPDINQEDVLNSLQSIRAIQWHDEIKKTKYYGQPETLLKTLSLGYGGELFNEIIICNYAHFPTLMDIIQEKINRIGNSLEKILED